MRETEVEHACERNTGLVIVETYPARGLSSEAMPAVLVANHALFTWGDDIERAIEHARVLNRFRAFLSSSFAFCANSPSSPSSIQSLCLGSLT
jgi:L-ribulose-5-phosphate 4-epimerase